MPASFFRERLPSAVVAIALQVGLFALLAMSFEVVRNVSEEKETILHLTPLPRPVPRRPVIMVGRRKPAPVPPPRAATAVSLPAWATPGFTLRGGQIGIPLAPRTGAPDCRPENYTNLNTTDRQACSPLDASAAKPDGTIVELNPPSHVKDEARWQAEMARKNTPLDLGITNAKGEIGFTIQDPLCQLTGLFMRNKCGPIPVYHTYTDAQFQAARAAAETRIQSIYGSPALTPGSK